MRVTVHIISISRPRLQCCQRVCVFIFSPLLGNTFDMGNECQDPRHQPCYSPCSPILATGIKVHVVRISRHVISNGNKFRSPCPQHHYTTWLAFSRLASRLSHCIPCIDAATFTQGKECARCLCTWVMSAETLGFASCKGVEVIPT